MDVWWTQEFYCINSDSCDFHAGFIFDSTHLRLFIDVALKHRIDGGKHVLAMFLNEELF